MDTYGKESASSTESSDSHETTSSLPIDTSVAKSELGIMRRSTSAEILRDSALNTRHEVPKTQINFKAKVERWKRNASTELRTKVTDRKEVINTILPCLRWMRVYDIKSNLMKDMIAGLTVGVMVIPQSMSYAKLAGLPVEYGLYSALMPVFAYAVWGASRQLAVGPVALVSLLVSTSLTAIVDPVNADGTIDETKQLHYNRLAVETALLVGVVYLGMGLLRLGFVTVFMSHAVISGFTTGAAVIIALSQIKYFFGYEVERFKVLHKGVKNLFDNIDKFDWRTFLMGSTCLAILLLLKQIGKHYKRLKWMRAIGPLVVTTLSILLTWAVKIDIPIIESIPEGLPPVTITEWKFNDFNDLIIPVLVVTVVGFMESIAIAKQLASKHKYDIDASQELIGLGMSNFIGSMFGAYPITGSFSRSAVNNDSGAVSGLSGICTASLVGIVLVVLTPVFEQMPLATLAAIVISGVLNLFDYEEAMYLWRVHKLDFAIWFTSFLGTLFLGAEKGIAIAIIISLLSVIHESAYPHTAVLGKLPGTNVYRNIKQYPNAQRYNQIVITRIDAPVYFANVQHVREKLQKYEENAVTIDEVDEGNKIKFMIVDCSPVSHVDSSALHILKDMCIDYQTRDVQLCLCNPNIKVMVKLVSSGLVELIGEEYIFVSTQDAVQACLTELEPLERLDEESPR